MSAWFVDSQYYIALLSADDAHHVRARSFAQSPQAALVTTQWVLGEVGNAMARPEHRSRFVALVQLLKSKANVTIVEASGADFERGLALYVERPDKSWSLVDCISFAVMSEWGIHEALTADRHFEQAGFVALLK